MFGATFVIFNYYDKELETVYFDTLSGELIVNRKRSLWDGFPKYELTEVDIRREMIDAIGCEPKKAFMRRDLWRSLKVGFALSITYGYFYLYFALKKIISKCFILNINQYY